MAGVWHFDQGVARLDGRDLGKTKVLVYKPTKEQISSLQQLEALLMRHGWSRLYPSQQPGTIQFHRSHFSGHLITLPSDFRSLKPMHYLDIAMKIRDFFEVRDRQ
ncbi:hypothetical protein KP509_34G048900 [Ceratopteris richardii]|uniref:Uncharacterized protein n=1 Tax=Ceratopteris richardii TaxID=49495 RepID=A0A8T2QK85_CERRI|nr:hypothetical protein KP509_34G048900 [Ceratopteris richardii]